LKNDQVIEQKITIKGIPVLLFTPIKKTDSYPTIFFYHGWGSDKESQRFRGYILATLGFQVVLPDALYHGQRGTLDYDLRDNAAKYFWKVILNNITESDLLIEEVVKNYKGDKNNIGMTGHSMGGFTASGIFTNNATIKALCVVNGSCAWNHTNHIFAEHLDLSYSPLDKKDDQTINELDPINHVDQLIDRPILLLHGDKDSLVPIDSQRTFYKKIAPLYSDKAKINFIEYPRLNHHLTTQMMEEMYMFFEKHLSKC